MQVSWLGYFATTGTPNMDYVLMDPWHVPEGCEYQFTERMLRLPHTRFCFQPIDAAPPVAPRRASAAARCTFGSFDNLVSSTSLVVQAWSRVLHGVPAAGSCSSGARSRYRMRNSLVGSVPAGWH